MINLVFEKNMKLLQKKYPHILEKIISLPSIHSEGYEVVNSKMLLPTLKITKECEQYYLHSKYDPIKEAEAFIKEHCKPEIQCYIIYGIGFLYHIREILKNNENVRLFVFEANKFIFRSALENIDLQEILLHPNVKIFLEDTVKGFAQQFETVLGNSEEKELIVHLPSLKAIPKELVQIKYLLENYRIHQNTINKYSDRLIFNFNENIKGYDANVDALFGKFADMPVIIVSAGPSLDKNKDLLRESKGKALILAVGTVVKPLLNIGVFPDLIIITDPQDIVCEQLEGLDISIPLIILSTCNHRVMKNYKGIKLMALQQGFDLAEAYAKDKNNNLVRTGGSVSTTALDVALRIGCNPVVFAGLDLAYSGGYTHAKGTHLYKEISNVKGLRSVSGYYGNLVYTSKNLYIYLKWIEKRIKEEKGTIFINATEGGAFIEGTQNLTLREVVLELLKNKEYNFGSLIERLMKNG